MIEKSRRRSRPELVSAISWCERRRENWRPKTSASHATSGPSVGLSAETTSSPPASESSLSEWIGIAKNDVFSSGEDGWRAPRGKNCAVEP